MKYLIILSFLTATCNAPAQNTDPLKMEIVTTDLDNFWNAFDKAKPGFNAEIFKEQYFDKASKGLKGFIKYKIKSVETLVKIVSTHPDYFNTLKASTDSIAFMKDNILTSMIKLKELYPKAVFPPVYFVIGAMNSAGTALNNELVIGAEMHGRTAQTNMNEFSSWHRAVLKPVGQINHIVAHEIVHFQQQYDGGTLLQACIKEGSADFIGALISGNHINQHVHDFANPMEKELWLEFKERMHGKDYNGWLYSAVKNRPNDLGYWMGYKIAKSYYDNMTDKKKAIHDILTIKDFDKFLADSKYPEKFN